MEYAKFFQDPIVFQNQFDEDLGLQKILTKYLPSNIFNEIKPDLKRFGEYVVSLEILNYSRLAEENPPKLTQFDNWGRRIDKLDLNEGWKFMKGVSAREGLIAIGYNRDQGEYSRIYQYAKLYLFSPSSAMYTCPLAMTDGAARVMELMGTSEMKNRAYKHLTSRDPKLFWTSGQWMTERPGGSDVSMTETVAKQIAGKSYGIHGFKWFSSATDAEMTLLLARTIKNDGSSVQGSKGLSLFYGELFLPNTNVNKDPKLNGIKIQRLKNKYGTKSLPTAELELEGMVTEMVGEEHRGVAQISHLFNITRIHTAIGVVGAMRRALVIAKDFSKKRFAFGKLIQNHPLHVVNLAEQEITFRACLNITFFVINLLGESEVKKTEQSSCLLRLLTPVVKSFTAKLSLNVISECMECLGGVGYIEETRIGQLLRDTQVNTIWEGTTNVLGLDVVRVLIGRDGKKIWEYYLEFSNKILNSNKIKTSLQKTLQLKLNQSLQNLKNFIEKIFNFNQEKLDKKEKINYFNLAELNARQILFYFGKLTCSLLLFEESFNGDLVDLKICERWVASSVGIPSLFDGTETSIDFSIAMDSKL